MSNIHNNCTPLLISKLLISPLSSIAIDDPCDEGKHYSVVDGQFFVDADTGMKDNSRDGKLHFLDFQKNQFFVFQKNLAESVLHLLLNSVNLPSSYCFSLLFLGWCLMYGFVCVFVDLVCRYPGQSLGRLHQRMYFLITVSYIF
jgi:hypothetical protein